MLRVYVVVQKRNYKHSEIIFCVGSVRSFYDCGDLTRFSSAIAYSPVPRYIRRSVYSSER